jgi:AcrR family transcriptional regulator
MSIRLDGDPRRDKILHAALAVFARYGFKRASMEDVATEAGISRPALYQSYENKAAIFAALAVALGQASCDAAEAAWPADLAFEEGLAAAGLLRPPAIARRVVCFDGKPVPVRQCTLAAWSA